VLLPSLAAEGELDGPLVFSLIEMWQAEVALRTEAQHLRRTEAGLAKLRQASLCVRQLEAYLPQTGGFTTKEFCRAAEAAMVAAGVPPGVAARKVAAAKLCSFCGAFQSPGVRLSLCSSCQQQGARYCSKECQAKAWPVHKMECVRHRG
jgi:hypothetical protein